LETKVETRNYTLINAFIDQNTVDNRTGVVARNAGLALIFSLLLALSAQVRIPLFNTPVPITGQTFVVLLAGALLGPRLGAATMVAYLLEGAAGLPFFQGGNGGLAYLLGPTGGYLIGYIPAAAIAGWFAERGLDRRFVTAVVMMIAAEAAIYGSGLAWLSYFVPAGKVLGMGLLPFIVVDMIKILAAAAVLPTGWFLLSKIGRR
jgi:biotin transporter BioY